MTVLVPVSDLFDAGVFEVVGQRGLARAGRGAGEDIAAGEGHPTLLVFGPKRDGQRNDAGAADEEVDVGLEDPAIGFVFLQVKGRDGFDGETRDEDFSGVGGELFSDADGTFERAVGFAFETSGRELNEVRQERVIGGIRDAEAIFNGGELGEEHAVR